jgi:hypothetical protein
MATNELDDFLIVAIDALNGGGGANINANTNANANNANAKDPFFEGPLTEIGKELDGAFNTFNFLLDGKIPIMNSDSKPFTTINELNMVFNKSQSLYPPNQFSQMKLRHNVYIENPKAGDWFRFTTDNIEEGLINLKDKNKHDPENTVKDLTIIRQKIP